MNELINLVEEWSKEKGLNTADSKAQYLKVAEETGEIAAALARSDEDELKDAIGDVVVTLIILSQQNDMDLYECLNVAYDEIKGRTGKMIDGVFVKGSGLMINQEEYEMLKDLDDNLKWIVRSRYGWLFATRTIPIKIGLNWKYGGIGAHLFTDKESETLGFIKWTDDAPYSIDELIRDYEYTADYYASQFAKLSKVIYGNESEETEVKDIEWAKKEITSLADNQVSLNSYHDGQEMGLRMAIGVLNQLDEPEINKSVIPQFVAEYIVRQKSLPNPLSYVINNYLNGNIDDTQLNNWIYKNFELFIRAWLAYPDIEVEQEQKYYVYLGDGQYLVSEDKLKEPYAKIRHECDSGFANYVLNFTEQEIKDFDKRYWAFRKPVEEAE